MKSFAKNEFVMKGASNIAPFGLRMPEGVKSHIAEMAKVHGRSMNAEIVYRLETTIKKEDVIRHKLNLHKIQNPAIAELEAIKEQIERAIERLKETSPG